MHFRLKITPTGQVMQLLEAYRDIHGRPRKRCREEFEKADGFAPVEGRSEKKTVLLKRILETPTVPAQQPPEPQQNTEHKAQQPEQLEQPQTYTEQIILCKSRSRATKERTILSNAVEKFLQEIAILQHE